MHKGERFLQYGVLDLKVYQKPINLYLYIAFSSEEPLHVKKGLIKTELSRYVRICSNELSFQEIRSFFFLRLRDRGYAFEFLSAEFEKVLYLDREKFLYSDAGKKGNGSIF